MCTQIMCVLKEKGLVNGYANVRKGDRLALKPHTKAMFTNYGLATYCTYMWKDSAGKKNISSFFYVNICIILCMCTIFSYHSPTMPSIDCYCFHRMFLCLFTGGTPSSLPQVSIPVIVGCCVRNQDTSLLLRSNGARVYSYHFMYVGSWCG